MRKTNRRTEENGIVFRDLETGEGEEELHRKSKLFFLIQTDFIRNVDLKCI